MNCLSCEHILDNKSKNNYHLACSRKLFDTSWTPTLNFSGSEVPLKAREMIGKISISGVQPKLSIKVDKSSKSLIVTAKQGTHILKPSPDYFPHLAENENLCMNLAQEFSIETPPHGLLPLSDNQLVYIVKRFDRIFDGETETKIHVEDFTQLLEKDNKYNGSIEQIGNFLKKYSEIPFIDTQKLFIRTLFNFLIGNGDAHLKNFSMVRPLGKGYRLSNAYDIVNSRLVIPNETEEMALTINGKKNNISLKDFEVLAKTLEIHQKQYSNTLKIAQNLRFEIGNYTERSFLPADMKEKFISIFGLRYSRLFSK